MDADRSLREVTAVIDDWGIGTPAPSSKVRLRDDGARDPLSTNTERANSSIGPLGPFDSAFRPQAPMAPTKRDTQAQLSHILKSFSMNDIVHALLQRFSLSDIQSAFDLPPAMKASGRDSAFDSAREAFQRPTRADSSLGDVPLGQPLAVETQRPSRNAPAPVQPSELSSGALFNSGRSTEAEKSASFRESGAVLSKSREIPQKAPSSEASRLMTSSLALETASVAMSSRDSVLKLKPKLGKSNSGQRGSPSSSQPAVESGLPVEAATRNYTSQLLEIIRHARQKTENVVIFVRGEQQGEILERCLESYGFQTEFFPLGVLRSDNFSQRLRDFEVLITTPAVWNRLPVELLPRVPHIVDSSGDSYKHDIDCIDTKIRGFYLQPNLKIQISTIEFKEHEVLHEQPQQISHGQQTGHGLQTPCRISEPALKLTEPPEGPKPPQPIPKTEYSIPISSDEDFAIWTWRDGLIELSSGLNRHLETRGLTVMSLTIGDCKIINGWNTGFQHWLSLIKAQIECLPDRGELDQCLDLTKEWMEALLLIPFEGLSATEALMEKKVKRFNTMCYDQRRNMTLLEWAISLILRHVQTIPPGLQADPHPTAAFLQLKTELEKWKTQRQFHAVICVMSGFQIEALNKRLSSDPTLSSWVTVCHLYTRVSGSKYKMTKTEHRQQITDFSTALTAVMVITAPYREIGEAPVEAIFFYGVKDSFQIVEKTPDVITIINPTL